jgi:hypothetical protein
VDAGIAAGVRAAFGAYGEAADSAAPALREVASDAELQAALRSDRSVSDHIRRLVRASGDVVAIELRSPRGHYGHQQGDEVLASVPGVLGDFSRTSTPRRATGLRSWR